MQVQDSEDAAAGFRELQQALADAETQLEQSQAQTAEMQALEQQLQDLRAQLDDAVTPPPFSSHALPVCHKSQACRVPGRMLKPLQMRGLKMIETMGHLTSTSVPL